MKHVVAMVNADGSYTNIGRPMADRMEAEKMASDASSGGGAEVAVLEDGGSSLTEVARYADGEKLEPSDEREQVAVPFRKPASG